MGKLNQLNTVLHLTASGFLACTIILNFFFATEEFLAEDPDYLLFAKPFAGVVSLATGLVSYKLLKPSEDASDLGKAGSTEVDCPLRSY